MSRQGRGEHKRRQERRQAVQHVQTLVSAPPSSSPSSASVLSASPSTATTTMPSTMPSPDALAEGRVVLLSQQPAARAVASYAGTAAALQAQQAQQAQQARNGAQFTQPGVMAGTDRQYPVMPTISRKSPLLESMGAPGTAIFQGIITNDDYNPDFYWRDAVEIYDQMVRNDGQIMAIVQQLELPIRRATWTVEPFSDAPRDKEIASFVESCLFHDLVRTTADGRRIHQKWDDILRHALMMLRYGFACFEKVWREEDGWVKLAHLMPLLPMSVYRWWVGQDNELVGIQQYTFKNYTYCFVDIPADKVLLFTHRQEGQNFQGFSLLRAAYKHWYYKDQFYKIDAIGLERNAIAVPFIELPPSFNQSDVSNAQSILANLRANESMGVTLPSGWKIGYIPNSEHYAGHAMESIKHHDIMIARAVLAQFLNAGSNETGTYNLAVDQTQTFLEALQAEAEYIEDCFSSDLIPQLVDFNFADVEGYPRIKCSKLAQADVTELTDAISKLKARDANFLTPDPELEDWVRDQFGMPKASKSLIAGANPTTPGTPGRPDAQPGQATSHANTESAPVQGKPAPESVDAASGDAGDGGTGGGDGGAAAQAAELAADTRLLAESLAESLAIIAGLDATERGLQAAESLDSLLLFNPNHDPHSGEFASGGGGGGGGATAAKGGSKTTKGSAKGAGKGSAKGAGKGGAGAAGGAKGAAGEGKPAEEDMHAKSARLQREQGLRPEVQPEFTDKELQHGAVLRSELVPERTWSTHEAEHRARFPEEWKTGVPEGNPAKIPNAHEIVWMYGEHQLGAALSRFPQTTLRAVAEEVGIKPGASKAATISRIVSHVTQGRYSANFSKAGAGPKMSAHAAKSASYERRIATAQAKLDKLRSDYEAHKASAKASEASLARYERAIRLAERDVVALRLGESDAGAGGDAE